MVDASGTSAYGCYLGGQLASETGPWAANTVSYGYSSRLRVALANQQPTGSWTNGYSYDPARRLTGISGPSGSFGYLYVNAANVPGAGTLVGRVLLPNSAYLTNTYDSATRNALGDILSPSVANNW